MKNLTDKQRTFLLRVKKAHELEWLRLSSLHSRTINIVLHNGGYRSGGVAQQYLNDIRNNYKDRTLPILEIL